MSESLSPVPFPAHRKQALYAAVVLFALLCLLTRVGHIFYERYQWAKAGGEPHKFESEVIAENLVAGRGFSFPHFGKLMPTANAPPGLVFVLAALYATGVPEPNLVFQLFQAVTSGIALVLTWLLARRAFGEAVAFVAAGLFVLDLNLSYTTVWIQETALNVLFTLLGLWGLTQLADRPTTGRAIGCGVAFGLGILVRPTIASILLVGLGWLIFQMRGRSLTRRCVPIGGILLTTVVVLAPWTLRNYLVFGRFIPVSQNVGLSLWYGYNPRATGSQVDAQGRDLVPEGELLAKLQAAETEVEIDRAYRQAAFRFIREHPWQALRTRLNAFAYYWLDHNYWLAEPKYRVPWWIKAGNIVLVGLTAIGVLRNLARPGWHAPKGRSVRWPVHQHAFHFAQSVPLLLLLAIAASCLTYTLIHADVGNRYRMQIEPLMLIFIAALMTDLAQRLRNFLHH